VSNDCPISLIQTTTTFVSETPLGLFRQTHRSALAARTVVAGHQNYEQHGKFHENLNANAAKLSSSAGNARDERERVGEGWLVQRLDNCPNIFAHAGAKAARRKHVCDQYHEAD
jgi:hypothetical protein